MLTDELKPWDSQVFTTRHSALDSCVAASDPAIPKGCLTAVRPHAGRASGGLGRSIQGYLEKGIETPVAQGRSTHFDD